MSLSHLPAPPASWITEIIAFERTIGDLFWKCMEVQEFHNILKKGLSQTPSAWAMDNLFGLSIQELFLTGHVSHKISGGHDWERTHIGFRGGSLTTTTLGVIYPHDFNEANFNDANFAKHYLKPSSWLLHTKNPSPEEVKVVEKLNDCCVAWKGWLNDPNEHWCQQGEHWIADGVSRGEESTNKMTDGFQRTLENTFWKDGRTLLPSVIPRTFMEWQLSMNGGKGGYVEHHLGGLLITRIHEPYPLISLWLEANKHLQNKRDNFAGLRKAIHTKKGDLKRGNQITWEKTGYMLSCEARCFKQNTRFNREKTGEQVRLLRQKYNQELFTALKSLKHRKEFYADRLAKYPLLWNHIHQLPPYPEHTLARIWVDNKPAKFDSW